MPKAPSRNGGMTEAQQALYEPIVDALIAYGLDGDIRKVLVQQPEQWAVGEFQFAAGVAQAVAYTGTPATPQVLDTYEQLDPRLGQIGAAGATTNRPFVIALGLRHRVGFGQNVLATSYLDMARQFAAMATRWTPAGGGTPAISALGEGFRAGPFAAIRTDNADIAVGGHSDGEAPAFVLRFPWWIDTQTDLLQLVYGGGPGDPPTTPLAAGVNLCLVGALVGKGLVTARPPFKCWRPSGPTGTRTAAAVQGIG